jgi:hypothetical protein
MRSTLTYNLWSEKEIELLKSLVGKISFTDMIKHFPGRTPTSLLKKSIKLGMSSNYIRHIYNIDMNYWKNLDIKKCYYAGFIATDGNLNKKNNSLVINLNPKDISILENFKKEVGYTGNIRIYKRKKYKSEELKNVCYLQISGIKEWYKDLNEKFTIMPNKTYTLNAPNINNNILEIAYLIGAIDGDGWVISGNNKLRIKIGFVSASYDFIKWVYNKLKFILNNKEIPKISKQKNKKCHYFVINDIKAAIIIDYLRQFPVPKLDRKWNNPRILQKIDEYKQKYPHLFKTLNLQEIQEFLPNV